MGGVLVCGGRLWEKAVTNWANCHSGPGKSVHGATWKPGGFAREAGRAHSLRACHALSMFFH